jgi:Na+/H+ antiporter NhaA
MSETNGKPVSDFFTAQRLITAIVALPLTAFALLVLRNQLRVGIDLVGGIFGSGAAAGAFICWWFALRGHIPESRRRMRFALLGGCILGGIGFAAGFFGPMVFAPTSNQGPLLGIFITGPLGFILGTASGCLYARVHSSKQRGQKGNGVR